MSETPPTELGEVAARHGATVEVGEPVFVGGALPWACPAKLVGRERRLPRIQFDDEDDERPPSEPAPEPEPTHTLLLRTGRGRTPEEARDNAIRQLERPLADAPQIKPRNTQSPPPPLKILMAGGEVDPGPKDTGAPPGGFLARLLRRLRRR